MFDEWYAGLDKNVSKFDFSEPITWHETLYAKWEEPVISVSGVALDKAELSMNPGNTAQLNAAVSPEDAANRNVSWSSSNTDVATVDGGTVTAVSAGSADGGETWTEATAETFPSDGLQVALPYPTGTDSSYLFKAAHMFTSSTFGKIPGDVEYPEVENTEDGIRFTVTGLSPISVGWTKSSEPEKPPVTPPSRPSDGGSYYPSSSSKPSNPKLETKPVPDVTPEPVTPVPTSCTGGADCPSYGFADIGPVGTWYHEAVDYVLKNGLMNGYNNGLFHLDKSLSRVAVCTDSLQ